MSEKIDEKLELILYTLTVGVFFVIGYLCSKSIIFVL